MSNRGNVMLEVTSDSCGRHDTCAGACSCESNTVRFGHETRYQHACRENFMVIMARYGMTKRDIVPNINFFMNVPIEPSGAITVVDGVSKPGRSRRASGAHGRDLCDLELSANQQSLQRLRPDADPCHDPRLRHVRQGLDR